MTRLRQVNVETPDGEEHRTLFHLRYFSRLWVLQEIANSQSAVVHYGGEAVGWADFDQLRDFDVAPKWIGTIYKRKRYTALDLPELLHQTTSCKASDPRDQVFALFGLIQDASAYGLVADYSLTPFEVFVGTAAFALLKCDFGLLALTHGKDERWLPSWAPNWNKQPVDTKKHKVGTPEGVSISSLRRLCLRSSTVLELGPFALDWTRGKDLGLSIEFKESVRLYEPIFTIAGD
ncbi:hypothetical protein OQA88_1433 [Cercophora sp. LCS_1]